MEMIKSGIEYYFSGYDKEGKYVNKDVDLFDSEYLQKVLFGEGEVDKDFFLANLENNLLSTIGTPSGRFERAILRKYGEAAWKRYVEIMEGGTV